MALNQEVKERIFAAADDLYAANPDGEFPNVEAVRQVSRAGMNNVVEAMKEWRAKRRQQVQAVRAPLPAELHGVLQTAAQNLWDTAQQLANESLEVARSAFEAERNDLAELSTQQSTAFEAQAAELEAAQARIAELETQATDAAEQQQQQAAELADVREQHQDSQQRATLAEQKAQETELRAAELRAELNRAHQNADRAQERAEAQQKAAEQAAKDLNQVNVALATLRAQMDASEKTFQEQRKAMGTEALHQAERFTGVQAERDQARRDEAKWRDEAATLRGRLEVLEPLLAQNRTTEKTPASSRSKPKTS
jgi:uncharacterized coiled-coil DUF342 family protein